MEDEVGYKSGGTAGGKCGCLAAALFALLTGGPIIFFIGYSGAHCEPAPACYPGERAFLFGALAVIFSIAALFGFSIRAILNWLIRRRRGAEGARPPYWALVGAILPVALAVWISWELYSL